MQLPWDSDLCSLVGRADSIQPRPSLEPLCSSLHLAPPGLARLSSIFFSSPPDSFSFFEVVDGACKACFVLGYMQSHVIPPGGACSSALVGK